MPSQFDLIFSEPHIVIPQAYWHPPIGLLLQQADLINTNQLIVALEDQKRQPEHLLGEILVLRGWLQQPTADFFGSYWRSLVEQTEKQPLGYYLREAYLLNEAQIQAILSEQQKLGLKFGATAVLRGWLKPTTLDFFVQHLFPERQADSPRQEKFCPVVSLTPKPLKPAQTILNLANSLAEQLDDETMQKDTLDLAEVDLDDIPWQD